MSSRPHERGPRVKITRLVHSCHLIELDGKVLLTDPWFSTRPGYDPGEPLACTVSGLPDLDAVVITHAHYDHCDLDAFHFYRDLAVPLIGPPSVVARALDAGFTQVHQVQPWDRLDIGGVRVTAVPAAHAVEEITFVLSSERAAVYFGGDTLLIPALAEIPERVGAVDVALLPTNGLRLRTLHGMRVVMDAEDAARLVAILRPALAIPHHYWFVTGQEPSGPITSGDDDPAHFVEQVRRLAPEVTVRVSETGETVELP